MPRQRGGGRLSWLFTRKKKYKRERETKHRQETIKAVANQARQEMAAKKESNAAAAYAAKVRANAEEARAAELRAIANQQESERAEEAARKAEEEAYLASISPERKDIWLKTRNRIPFVRCSA